AAIHWIDITTTLAFSKPHSKKPHAKAQKSLCQLKIDSIIGIDDPPGPVSRITFGSIAVFRPGTVCLSQQRRSS
ncbi:MAG: hypothetical protein AAF959_06140, partial [Cyanobacteria bacterium P01_D01_bin.56]